MGLGRLDEKMIVVVHQAIGVTDPAIPRNHITEGLKESAPVPVI
jgi:hypothetical protein